jgi:Zn-dependent protease with chaperone function
MRSSVFALILILPLVLPAQKPGRQAEVKIQKTSLTRDQEIQLGKEAAAQVEREMEVVHNPEVEAWLNRIGQNLANTPQANAYPFYFKIVNEDSINAFALPGGPMYVHTGLLKAADTEGEVAGVLAHEMSHVALRHGAAQMGKQQTWGTLFGVLGAAVGVAAGGSNGECGMLCQAGQLGAGIGGASVLTRFSRGYEHDADLNGARMMASAGYNPMDLPRFFEKLQSKLGSAGEPKGLSLWLSDHPATGSRIQYVADDIRFYSQRDYNADTGQFPRIKQLVARIPAPKPKPAFLVLAKKGATARSNIPDGFKDYQANGFAVAYPATWQAGQAKTGGSLYIIPQGGALQSRSGDVELVAGAMIDYYIPKAGTGAAVDLEPATREFLDGLRQGDQNLRYFTPERVQIGGQPAMVTRLTTRTSSQSDPEQTARLYTVVRETGIWYIVAATPPSRQADFDPILQQIVRSVQFPD